MIDSEIHDQTYQFFLEEVPELLQILETGLLNLHQERSSALIHDLMRSAHSIKGGAATVGLDSLATIAHRLETILRGLHSDKVELDSELETWLLQAYDCLKDPLQQQIDQGSFDPQLALSNAEYIFTKIENQLGEVLKEADGYLPSSSEMGVDMVSSIFEVDVAQGIERLSLVLENPQDYEVAGELRAQAEVFAGFAEILSLPGFGEIAATAIAALDAHPDKVLEIIPLALADFKASRELILGGDRQSGGSPSEALKAFSLTTPAELKPDFEPLFSSDVPTAILNTDCIKESLDNIESLFPEEEEEIDFADFEIISEAIVDPEPEPEPEPEIIATTTEVSTTEQITAIISQPKPVKDRVEPKPSPVQSSQQKTQIQSITRLGNTASLKVKVDLNRLERMNNLVGELVIDRNSLALQQEQLQAIISKIQQGLKQFHQLTSTLENLSDQSAIASANPFGLQVSDSSIEAETLDNQNQRLFDSLEMDSYGTRHSSIQQVLEEMMQLEEAVEDLSLFTRQSEHTIKNQQQTLTKLRDELMWARMLPLEKVLNHFPRALRDLSTRHHKPVSLKMEGTEILVDKGILEKLHDPIMHLIRNAFDHGIEPAEIRRKQNKSETGTITIRAAHQGNRTLIEISDDGRGLDLMKIAKRAIDRGWLSIEQLPETDKEQLLNFIFEPGFSTADRLSELSGRGVGLDVVRSQLQAVKGTVEVDSSPGKGTTFTLSLPLSLTIAKLLVCSVGTTLLALPVASVQEIIPSTSIKTKKIGEQKVISWRDDLLPVYRLSDLLEYGYPTLTNQNSTLANGSAMLVIRSEKSNFAIEVEDFGTEQEMVIKPITGVVTPPNYVYGCTVMGNGNLIPAIDAVALLAYSKQKQNKDKNTVKPAIATYQNISTSSHVPTVLVVDDSAMMRKTLALTLQKVGYRVLQARDGQEAIELLGQNSAFDLIVSDLEMPKLNGFEFLNQLRQDPELSEIPVVMLTTRSNNKHRQLALHLGASAYMSKPYIEQEFLEVLRTTVNSKTDHHQTSMSPLPYAA